MTPGCFTALSEHHNGAHFDSAMAQHLPVASVPSWWTRPVPDFIRQGDAEFKAEMTRIPGKYWAASMA
jgi:hypothetical protein